MILVCYYTFINGKKFLSILNRGKQLEAILELMDPPAGFRPWHGGPTLAGALRGVDVEQAAWKPASDRHSIWELALHIAYWNYAVRRYLDPSVPKGFGRSPANWPAVNEPADEQWKQDRTFIKKEHAMLVEAIRSFPAARLGEVCAAKEAWTYRQLLDGVVAHDTYHIGQIQLMKRLYKSTAK